MIIDANSPDEYVSKVPEERRAAFSRLRQILRKNLPKGFQETMSYGMIGFVVPHTTYPDGYHVNPELPLPFINIASQKNFIALYHSGIYADPEIKKWFRKEYEERVPTKLDMGKSCIRFKNPKNIPFGLLEELAGKISVDEWIGLYEKTKRHKA